jgi:hypothetical protein
MSAQETSPAGSADRRQQLTDQVRTHAVTSHTDKLEWHMSIREAYIAAGVITPKAEG